MLIHSQTQNAKLLLWRRAAHRLLSLLVGSPHPDTSTRSTRACTLQAPTIIPASLADQILLFFFNHLLIKITPDSPIPLHTDPSSKR